MKIDQTVVEKTFYVRLKNKVFYVNFFNSDGQTLGLLNRYNWEIYDEDHNELDLYTYWKPGSQIKKNRRLAKKLINFCINHFNDFNPLVCVK